MPHSAFHIVEEFLRSRDPQVRKNALTALAVLERDEEAVERLAKAALYDADDGVRGRAVEEVVGLSDDALPRAVGVLQGAMSNAAHRQSAYALLGHMKSLGRALPRPRSFLSLHTRLRLAWAAYKHTYPARRWRFRFRTWKAAFVGAALGLAAVIFSFYETMNWGPGMTGVVLVYVPVLALFACVFAAWHTTPLNIYFDRPAAYAVEIGSAFLYSLATAVTMGLLSLLYEAAMKRGAVFIPLAFGLPLTAAAARAATLVSYGVWKRRWLNRAFQLAVGTSVVFLLVTLVNLVIWKFDHTLWELSAGEPQLTQTYQALESMWMALLPVGVAMALAYASVDAKSPLGITHAGRAGKYISYASLLAGLAVLLVVVCVGHHEIPQRGVNLNQTFDWLFGRPHEALPVINGGGDRTGGGVEDYTTGGGGPGGGGGGVSEGRGGSGSGSGSGPGGGGGGSAPARR